MKTHAFAFLAAIGTLASVLSCGKDKKDNPEPIVDETPSMREILRPVVTDESYLLTEVSLPDSKNIINKYTFSYNNGLLHTYRMLNRDGGEAFKTTFLWREDSFAMRAIDSPEGQYYEGVYNEDNIHINYYSIDLSDEVQKVEKLTFMFDGMYCQLYTHVDSDKTTYTRYTWKDGNITKIESADESMEFKVTREFVYNTDIPAPQWDGCGAIMQLLYGSTPAGLSIFACRTLPSRYISYDSDGTACYWDCNFTTDLKGRITKIVFSERPGTSNKTYSFKYNS